MITQNELKECLHYSIITGQFYWLKSNNTRIKIGSIAGSFDVKGYRCIRLFGKTYKSHRLAWLYITGEWPKYEIDHENGIKDANYWLNLREATHSENMQNKGVRLDNTSGFSGINWCKKAKKWLVRISLPNRRKSLGLYKTIELAREARSKAEKEYYGEFARK